MRNIVSKREFVENIIDDIPADATNDFAVNHLANYLLSNVPNGKLYKYRKVDSFSLSNLRENTLFCRKPSDFNDPFDCKLGIDFSSYFECMYDLLLKNAENFIFKFFNGEINGESKEVCSKNEIELLIKWENNPEVMSIIDDYRIMEFDLEQQKKVLEVFMKMILDYISIVGNVTFEEISRNEINNILSNYVKNIDNISEQSSSFDYLLDSMLVNAHISRNGDQISKIATFVKDKYPSNCVQAEKLEDDINAILNGLSAKIDEQWKVGCLSDSFENNLMWSHYADSYKGFCIEYDFSNFSKMNPEYLILPVCYSEERVIFPWDATLSKNQKELNNKGARTFLLSLVTKDKSREYESEWRIIAMSSMDINVKMPPISCVYLGACCSESDKSKILEITNERNIPVKQMKLDRGKYRVYPVDIN